MKLPSPPFPSPRSPLDDDDDRSGFDFDEEPQSHVKTERIRVKSPLGRFRRAIPTMPMCMAVLCCILNFIIPGLGTMLCCCSFCCADGNRGKKFHDCCLNFAAGVLQLLTCPFLLGIFWSFQWGILFISMATQWYRPVEKRLHPVDCLPCSSF